MPPPARAVRSWSWVPAGNATPEPGATNPLLDSPTANAATTAFDVATAVSLISATDASELIDPGPSPCGPAEPAALEAVWVLSADRLTAPAACPAFGTIGYSDLA